MSVNLLDENLNESIIDGFKRIDLVRTYLVVMPFRSSSAFSARNQLGVPRVGSVAVTVTGELLVCTNVKPHRVDQDKTGRKWHVVITLTNGTNDYPRDVNGHPVADITQAVKDVDITYLEHQEPVNSARLASITRKPWYEAVQADVLEIPPWLTKQQTNRGPITNSAGVVQEQTKRSFLKMITVSSWVSTWTDYDDYIGRINLDTITIEQSDSTGVKLSEVCAPRTLVLQDVIKEDVWLDGILYFRRRFVLTKNPRTWIRSTIDEGTKRILIIDHQYKPDNSGDKIDQAYLDAANIESTWGYEEITTTDQNGNVAALGAPVRFNGWGSNSPNQRSSTYDDDLPVFINSQVEDAVNFAPLGL